MDNFEISLKKSSIAFEKYFKNIILKKFGGNFEIVEGITKSEMAKKLDRLAGIDLWFFDMQKVFARRERKSGIR